MIYKIIYWSFFFIISSRQESSEDEETNRKSPARYDDEEDREEYDEYDNQSSRKQRVEVSLKMPQLPIPYSDNNKVYTDKKKKPMNGQ